MPQTIEIYDTTLRDGAQGPGVKFSSDDQLHVVRALDAFGVDYIEGGQPGSNPKAVELFSRARDMELTQAKMVAFGSTRHPRYVPEDDANLKALLSAGTEVVTIFCKSSPTHARHVLQVSLDENLALIEDSIRYLIAQGRRVILDGEHYFDGYFEDPEYALSVFECGHRAGAETLVLCETNGGRLPHEVAEVTAAVRRRLPEACIGVHTHNDSGCAVANTLAGVQAGATHFQGTVNGYGERTGNVDLCTVIANLQLKMGYDVVAPEQLATLTQLSHVVAELANMVPRDHQPYVGRDAFTHKGGMHADAVRKYKASYEHIDPVLVGNKTHIAVSELSGRSSVLQKATELGFELDRDNPATRAILDEVKNLENLGYEFEGADASLELIIRRATHSYTSFFETIAYHAHISHAGPGHETISEGTVKISLPDGSVRHTVSDGNGPVDALNNALRKALEDIYPELHEMKLEDYKVRILDGKQATRAKTRVLIESSDRDGAWNTVGVSENIITASYRALVDSIAYKLMRARGQDGQPVSSAAAVAARAD